MGNILLGLLIGFTLLSWFVHVGTCFIEGAWGFLISGAIFFPIGIVHGAGVMFGFW